MKTQLLLFFTCAAIFGHSLAAHARAWTCNSLFQSAEAMASIEEPLVALAESLHSLQSALKKPLPTEGADPMSALKDLREDPRELAYILQGSYRLLLSHPAAHEVLSAKQLAKLQDGLEQMKWLEKKLGTYVNAKELSKSAVKMSVAPDFVTYLQNQRVTAGREVVEKLRRKKFLTDEISTVDELLVTLRGMRKLNGRVAGEYIPESLRSEISRVRAKVETEMAPLILKKSYGYHELEEGAHAFRRSLRWLKVYIQAYRAHFSLQMKEAPLTASELALRLKYQERPEDQLSVDGPIKLQEMQYYQLIEMIADLRKIKGAGETHEHLLQSLVQYGRWDEKPIQAAQASALIQPLMESKLQDAELRTQAILKHYQELHSFQNLIIGGTR